VTGWPFPGDSASDRARQVALRYREALWNLDQQSCAAIDTAAVWAGEHWVLSEWAVETEDDLVTVPRAAELVGRSTRWVYHWAQTSEMVAATSPIRVRLSDVRAAVANRRQISSSRSGRTQSQTAA
jgi:hypothetical protein